MKKTGRFALQDQGTRIHDILRGTLDRISDIRRHKKPATGIGTGFYYIDDFPMGLHPSNLVVIAGRPSMGKTVFALNIVRHAVLELRKPVLYFSLDSGAQILARTLLCAHAGFEGWKLCSKAISHDECVFLASKARAFRNAPLFIDDTCGPSVSEIRSRALRYKARHKIEMVVIDYLQLLEARDAGWGDMAEHGREISIISRSLKALARELAVPVLVLSQVSRRTESRAGHRPMLSDLKREGGIDQIADLVLMLYRDEYYYPDTPDKNTAEIIVARNRYGPTGAVKLRFLAKIARFADLGAPPVDVRR